MPSKNDRPYFGCSIAQLEQLFETNKSDAALLLVLACELENRSTPRAAKLRSQTTEVLHMLAVENENVVGAQSASASTRSSTSPQRQVAEVPSKQIREAVQQAEPLPVLSEIEQFPDIPVPQSHNEPCAILSAWTALEALSPQTYCHPEDLAAGDRKCVADLSTSPLPWQCGERSRPKRQLYYQVILGSILMSNATEELIKAFGQDEECRTQLREKAAIAAILVDRNGVPVEENGVAISSFAWALPLTLQLKLGNLGTWPSIERTIIERIHDTVHRVDEEGTPLPLDLATIKRAYFWLIKQFGLPDKLIEPPTFAVRVYHYYKAKNPPEALLLNSFLIGDLARAASLVRSGKVPVGLQHYLGIEAPHHATDLLTDKKALEHAVAPSMMPAARWPSPGGYPLVLLQQAAVNLARAELANSEGMIAVNGPPGTGKTTLLRDVVAACVLDRALAMSAFDDPKTAFSPTGEKVPTGGTGFFQIYKLDANLKGHEVLVASSNNKAVENVSRELPAAKAVGRSFGELSYFRSVADIVHNARNVDADEDGNQSDPIETWGLIAAVLGNAANCFNFGQSFWWDKDRSFRIYLNAAKGNPVVQSCTPFVVLSEKPPSPQDATVNWRRSREKFLKLKHEVDAELKALERIRLLCLNLVETKTELSKAEGKLNSQSSRRPGLEAHQSQFETQTRNAQGASNRCQNDVANHLAVRPGLFSRLFSTRLWKEWSHAHALLVQTAAQASTTLQAAEVALAGATNDLRTLVAEIRRTENAIASLQQQVAELSHEIDQHRMALGNRLVDASFFAKGHEASNLASPWLPDSLHRKREDLFIAALAVHRSFIDASAQKVLHNLGILMNIFSGRPLQDDAKRKLLGDLWSTLFMVIPVLSTTFASVERMLGNLPPRTIGWLLIDEAGQALPQAAVGAVMRARRTIVVGDPLQIPPVVTLPEQLNTKICEFFKIDRQLWSAPEASAQTLADCASAFQSVFQSDQGPRRVGIPLLVHRRCQEPMFGISNRIAYDGQMVHAPVVSSAGKVSTAIGPSVWFDIDGSADSKWCPAEGELVVTLMKRIVASGVTDPDLFIITPFRIVAQGLRQRLGRETALFSALKIDFHKWQTDRIGTIHTVQGREAESVILVLGAPEVAQNKARCWAAGTPNILNVAVSRAKQNLYVVGSYGAWSGVGYAREVAEIDRLRL